MAAGNLDEIKGIERYLKCCHLSELGTGGETEWFCMDGSDFRALLESLYDLFLVEISPLSEHKYLEKVDPKD